MSLERQSVAYLGGGARLPKNWVARRKPTKRHYPKSLTPSRASKSGSRLSSPHLSRLLLGRLASRCTTCSCCTIRTLARRKASRSSRKRAPCSKRQTYMSTL
eukprot:Mycagemm_TRINITY_DN10033_c0_g1::TRINITY_DN10033_c0_g1_i2::g.2276::m.2276 type:complete len:102 gc:universal TRINITY_DN10033_c0_g1_i2:380-685(+)